MRRFYQKFPLSRLSIFSVLALAGFAAYFYFNSSVFSNTDLASGSPRLYSPVWRDSFSEGMVLPASCDSGYEHSSGACATPTCTVSFNPSTVTAGKNTTYYWNFSNNTVYYQTSCSGNLGTQEGPVPSYAAYNGYNSSIYPKQTQICSTTVRTAGGRTASCSAGVTVNPLGVNPEVSCPAGQNFADFADLGTPLGGAGISDPVIGGWPNGDLTILMEAPWGYPWGNLRNTIWQKKGSASGSGFSAQFDWTKTTSDTYKTSGRPKVIDEIVNGNPGPVVYAELVQNYAVKVLKLILPWNGWYQTTVTTANFGSGGPSSVSVPGVGTFRLVGRGPVTLQKCQGSQTLSVLKAGAGSGTVTSGSNPGQASQIDCGGACSASFSYGANVTLAAAPAGGSVFGGWSGDADCSDGRVTMNAAKTCIATFNPSPPDLIPLNPNANGFTAGSTLTFSAAVKNQGTGWANPSRTRMGLDIGNNGSYDRSSPLLLTNSLGSGSSQTLFWSSNWVATAGTHKLRIEADSTHIINEFNESNNVLDWIFTVAPANRAPVAVAKISTDGTNYANSITVTKGVPTTIYLSAADSSDPDGWTDSANGVSVGGYLQWNSDLNQGAPTFKTTINNPATPGVLSLGSRTFDDAPGTYTYQVLRISDKQGAQSNIATVQVTVAVPLSVAKSGSGKGAVTSNPAGINCNVSAQFGNPYEQGLKPEFDMNNDGLYNMEDANLVLIASVGRGCPAGKNCNIDGEGEVTSGDALLIGYYMPIDCSESYPVGTSVTLTASPDANSKFAGWSGDVTNPNSPVTFLMNAAKNVVATFVPKDTAPTVSNSNSIAPTDSEWCGAFGAPAYSFSWQYNDAEGDRETSFQFQAATDANFSNPAVVRTFSGLNNPSGAVNDQQVEVASSAVAGKITYNMTYYWRVKVFNANKDSGWVNGGQFTTAKHQYPTVSFRWDPKYPSAKQKVNFTDKTVFFDGGGNRGWAWTFADASPGNANVQNPDTKFNSNGVKQVALTATDADGFSCAYPPSLLVMDPLPGWVETKP